VGYPRGKHHLPPSNAATSPLTPPTSKLQHPQPPPRATARGVEMRNNDDGEGVTTTTQKAQPLLRAPVRGVDGEQEDNNNRPRESTQHSPPPLRVTARRVDTGCMTTMQKTGPGGNERRRRIGIGARRTGDGHEDRRPNAIATTGRHRRPAAPPPLPRATARGVGPSLAFS
jgi:hypothetical protein